MISIAFSSADLGGRDLASAGRPGFTQRPLTDSLQAICWTTPSYAADEISGVVGSLKPVDPGNSL